MRRKPIIVGGILFVMLAIIVGAVYYVLIRQIYKPEVVVEKQTPAVEENGCLKENEIAEYKLVDEKGKQDKAIIIIKDKETLKEKRRFEINITSATHYHPIELHICAVYAIQKFNYDYQTEKFLPNYKTELWRFNYNGKGESLLTLFKEEGLLDNFGQDFRVSLHERYLALERGYLGSPDYAIVIKSLKTLENIFVLPITEIEKQMPEIVGDIGFDDWSRDGKYFWVNTAYGATRLGFIRINSTNWHVDFLKAPKDVLGGDVLNLENGYITVHPGNVWFGIAQIEEQEKTKRRAQGIGTELYIHNLFTDERQFVASTTEPLWYFKPKWISDTELEYTLPSGEKKIFVIK